MMNNQSLQTSFWLMVLIQTIGSVDTPGRGPRKMPAPRQYIAILVTWLVLQFVAGIGAGAERGAAALGWLLVLVGMVVGPFGKQVLSFFQTVAQQFPSVQTPASAGSDAGAPAGPTGPVG